jgi:hypothetical protein
MLIHVCCCSDVLEIIIIVTTGTFKDGHSWMDMMHEADVIEYRREIYLPMMEKRGAWEVLPADFIDEKGEYEGDLRTAFGRARARAKENGHNKMQSQNNYNR